MLWWSRPSVIIGKHQNAFAEINLPFVRTNDIPVIRRLSGGGTVFHAPGNLNFTFIFRGEPGNMINFRKYTAPVIAFLNDLGVEAQFAGKNDIRAGGLKISGNAEHIYKDRVLHHALCCIMPIWRFCRRLSVSAPGGIKTPVSSRSAARLPTFPVSWKTRLLLTVLLVCLSSTLPGIMDQ